MCIHGDRISCAVIVCSLQGVVGSERSLKTAVVSLFVEGVLEIEGDEKGKGELC